MKGALGLKLTEMGKPAKETGGAAREAQDKSEECSVPLAKGKE